MLDLILLYSQKIDQVFKINKSGIIKLWKYNFIIIYVVKLTSIVLYKIIDLPKYLSKFLLTTNMTYFNVLNFSNCFETSILIITFYYLY